MSHVRERQRKKKKKKEKEKEKKSEATKHNIPLGSSDDNTPKKKVYKKKMTSLDLFLQCKEEKSNRKN